MIKIGVFGNRNITNKELVQSKFAEFMEDFELPLDPILIIHGGAAGPANIMAEYADKDQEWSTVLFKPWTMVWSKLEFQPIFFYLRNKQIVENSEIVFIVTNGEKDSEVYRVIDLCKRWNKRYYIAEV